MTRSDDQVAQQYHGYAQWKQWHGDFAASDREARYFAAELAGLDFAGREVLEIGFGNGAFLAWAMTQGARVTGTEIAAPQSEQARGESGGASTSCARSTCSSTGSATSSSTTCA